MTMMRPQDYNHYQKPFVDTSQTHVTAFAFALSLAFIREWLKTVPSLIVTVVSHTKL